MLALAELKIRRGHEQLAHLRKELKGIDCYLAGGFVRWVASEREEPAPYGDIDIYPNGHYDEIREVMHRRCLYEGMSEFAVSWKYERGSKPETWQIILPDNPGVVTSGELPDIIKSFDYTIVKAVMRLHEDKVFADYSFEIDENQQLLELAGTPSNPLNSLVRAFKYIQRGYDMKPLCLVKLVQGIRGLSDEAIDRFIGVVREMESLDQPYEEGFDWADSYFDWDDDY